MRQIGINILYPAIISQIINHVHNQFTNQLNYKAMPYIEVSKVAEIRNQLKKALPAFKLSVTREHYSCVNVAIQSGPVEFPKPYEQINQYYIEEHWKDQPGARAVLLKIKDITMKDERTMFIDGDYGAIPNYYVHISVGKWDKPYQLIK